MNMETRDPERFLRALHQEVELAKQGKLKIYLGAAPGVGKTYTMLQDAHMKFTQGIDIVAGIIETHGRIETEHLLKNIESLPKKTIEYRDKSLLEFDLESALKRKPQIILMDEIAHTNIPGSTHTKRWQDIRVLLEQGIDVYTTLNVQHVESLNELAAQIIQTPIKETVPDDMLDIANSIELIDLSPEDLIKRLYDGKIYSSEQIHAAKNHFFQKKHLIALRELALRITADQVEAQALRYHQIEGTPRISLFKEKILMCIDSRFPALKLIRTAKRMATQLKAEWIVIYPEQEGELLTRVLHIATDLGAKTYSIPGIHLLKEILQYSHKNHITRILVFKKHRPLWKEIWSPSLASKLVLYATHVDLHIVFHKNPNPLDHHI
jgi:two-component system sensor histidine kinase KdpD